jgi:hypothetical protein
MGRMLKRMLVLLALGTIGVVVSVNAAQAEVTANERVPLAFAGFVPCANGGSGEIVAGLIEVHNLITSTTNANNVSGKFQFQPQGSMVGAITGDTYRVTGVTQGTLNESLENGHAALTYVNNFRLIGPGPGNNLVVREIAHMTIDGDEVIVKHDDLSIDCG